MAKIYIIYGENKEKTWPVTSYIDVYSTKKHFNKLNEFISFAKEFNGPIQLEENLKNKYDPSGNIADKYYVITTTSWVTFDGFKAYMQLDEFENVS